MTRIALMLAFAGTLAVAQTPTAPAPKSATPASAGVAPKPGTKPGTAVRHTAVLGTACRPTSVIGIKLPPGIPVVKAVTKPAFTLCYEDIKIGTGAEAEPNKMYKVNYTGWLATDGRKFDSSFDHRMPVMDKDGKPQKDADGKPVLGDAQPFTFPQGFGRLIAGWDQGFEGMKVGGKRRLFIPWELAYGVRGVPARDADHPGIPPKSDLIFDIELLDVTDMPSRPAPGAGMRPMPARPGAAPGAAPGASASPTSPSSPATAPKPAEPASPAAAPAPTTPTPAQAPAPTDKPVNPEQPK
ncbi:FKBP-type peptidyl-prolyl cis-trans isomerase [Acidicapsa acidisoli]|uniref:FKBP-type peptidyl-prolyl cis-trans isomerase n=1 Tax=Acidicapsa acidisoli TaxID=1615681 RepID=UPI0021DFD5F2|nr:FKBP-type peptidyl-prolyl cis-trans isomerase [Acidicapsa acidisoli]